MNIIHDIALQLSLEQARKAPPIRPMCRRASAPGPAAAKKQAITKEYETV